jgi:hypothetical protein
MIITILKKEEGEESPVGIMKPYKGHTIYKYNTQTNALVKADFNKEFSNGDKSLIAEEHCIYLSSLNIKNAVKKAVKYQSITSNLKK